MRRRRGRNGGFAGFAHLLALGVEGVVFDACTAGGAGSRAGEVCAAALLANLRDLSRQSGLGRASKQPSWRQRQAKRDGEDPEEDSARSSHVAVMRKGSVRDIIASYPAPCTPAFHPLRGMWNLRESEHAGGMHVGKSGTGYLFYASIFFPIRVATT